MTIELWWPRLRPETRQWLIANNGDTVPDSVMSEIEAAGGPARSDPWWSEQEGSAGRCMPDEAVDWIEEIANEEGIADEEGAAG
ncbi:MAG TPA: hypothetical protein VMT69_04370 [Kineosporiaceae bacterium]|nr:hypothetical protein [Kineosporiaceae bacterium]